MNRHSLNELQTTRCSFMRSKINEIRSILTFDFFFLIIRTQEIKFSDKLSVMLAVALDLVSFERSSITPNRFFLRSLDYVAATKANTESLRILIDLSVKINN